MSLPSHAPSPHLVTPPPRQRIAVVGSGIAGLSCAWLLARAHDVVLYEKSSRPGGHSNTLTVPTPDGAISVDTGFIVYNEHTYPNLTALFEHLGVTTTESDMSFGVSRGQGHLEYAGSSSLATLFAQKRNLLRPRFWGMLRDTVRFYQSAPRILTEAGTETLSLGAYLDREGYGDAFIEDHLLPMGAAIWSAGVDDMRKHSVRAFVRFCQNHGLLKLTNRPRWRTVVGGSQMYVRRLTDTIGLDLRTGTGITEVRRPDGPGKPCTVVDTNGGRAEFDHVVLACHADQALALLGDADRRERMILEHFRTQPNEAWLHTDPSLMPFRRNAWASWNYLAPQTEDTESGVCVTYWMNRLQRLRTRTDIFVTLNPPTAPVPEAVLARIPYRHPVFDTHTEQAQRLLWASQGRRNTWFCGAWLGAGFHEDGLQTGLAVAERLGAVQRPWTVENHSDRLPTPATRRAMETPA